jgi:hypothetical protein
MIRSNLCKGGRAKYYIDKCNEDGALNRVLTAYQSMDARSLDGIYEERYLAHYRKYCENMEKRKRVNKIKERAKEIQSSRSLKKINSLSELKEYVKERDIIAKEFFIDMPCNGDFVSEGNKRFKESERHYDNVSSITTGIKELNTEEDVDFLIRILYKCKYLSYLKISNIGKIGTRGGCYMGIDFLIDAISNLKGLDSVIIGSSKMNEIKRLIEKSGRICEIE